VPVSRNWFAVANDDVGALVDGFVGQLFRGIANAESVRPTTAGISSGTPFILPVRLFEEHDIDAPNDDGLARVERFSRIDEVAPNNIPTGVVVVRLDGPGPLAPFAFQATLWINGSTAAPAKVGKSLLGRIQIAILLVVADRVERLGPVDTDDRTKYVRLLVVDID